MKRRNGCPCVHIRSSGDIYINRRLGFSASLRELEVRRVGRRGGGDE